MSGSMLKIVDLSRSQESLKKEMEDVMEKNMEEKMNGNREHMEKKMNENSAHMENKMDENMYQMEKKMNEMQISIKSMLLQRVPKRDTEIQGNPKNKKNNGVETQSHIGSILSQLDNTNTEFQNYSSLQDPHHQEFKSTPVN
jgi:hypothetical protein